MIYSWPKTPSSFNIRLRKKINSKILMTISCNNIRDIPRHYMINSKIDGKFSGKEEITGLNRSEKASLKFPSLSPCLGRTCSRKGLVQVLERMWNLS